MRNKLINKVMLGGLAIGVGVILAHSAAPPVPQGAITAKAFTDIGGTAVTDLTGNAKFPDNPDAIRYEPYFEWNATGDILVMAPDWADNYGVQMLGYFYPPTTGDYVFWLSSDDGGELWLSTNSDPANKKLIARETGWSGARSYNAVGGGSVLEEKNSQTFTATQWPTTDPLFGGAKITLNAGQAYYIEALMKEGGGGDNLSVAVQDPNFTIDSTMPIPGQYLATIDKTSGPISIVTQPQSLSVEPLATVVFRVVADGTPPYAYQWKRDGADIEGATSDSYTIDRVTTDDNGAVFTVTVTGAQGTVTSQEAVLTVSEDNTPPELANVTGSVTFNSVRVTFSEPVSQATAQAVANYQLSGGVTISAAALAAAPNDNLVILTTSQQPEATMLTLTVNNVQDLSGNTIAAGSTYEFQTFVWVPGVVLHEFWQDISANNIPALTNDARFPHSPTMVTLEPMFEYPPDGGNEGGSNYGNKLSAWFVAPFSGDYIFFVNGDDPAYLYLSTDANPANKYLIAQETGWSGARQWTAAGSGDPLTKRSDAFTGTQWPHFPEWIITLQAGQRYYIEALHTEGGGGDNVGATFIRYGDPDPALGSPPALTGNVIGSYLDLNGAVINITQQPQNITAVQSGTATFTVGVSSQSAYGPVHTIQWQTAPAGSATFTDIAGATQASYTTPMLTLADDGRQYRAIVRLLTLTETSDVAVLSINPDNVPPTVVSAGALAGDNQVGVLFNELVTAATAEVAGNYQVSGATVTSARLHGGRVVQLNLAGTVPGSFTVTVQNVADLAGNAMASTTVTGDVVTNMTAADIGTPGVNPLRTGDAFAFGANGFYVAGGGTDIWDNADAFQYVYRQFTGAFDMRANVLNLAGTHQWAKAALMARESLDAGSRHADVVATRSDGNGQNQLTWQWRDTTDGASGSIDDALRVNLRNNAQYPNTWIRLVREDATSNEFKAYWSNNGTSWNLLSARTIPPGTEGVLPATLYVGMAVTSHDNSSVEIPLAEALFNQFTVTEFQDVVDPELTIGTVDGNIVITWQAGTLVSGPTVNGPWTPVAGATSPYQVTPTENALFFQVQQ